MPYAWQKNHKKLPPELDRRRKLNSDDKVYIKKLYQIEKLGVREIARIYEKICSRRLIQFVLFSERRELVAKQSKERQEHKKTYIRVRGEEWAKIMRDHRHYKQTNKNKLI